MTFNLSILGTSAARPIKDRHPSSQILNCNECYYLIDCGEGTQGQIMRYGIKASRIDYIFISHLHGDHYLGLLPLLDSFNLSGRTKPMHIFSNVRLKEVIDLHLSIGRGCFSYPIVFHAVDSNEPALIWEDERLKVFSLILQHRVPCTGFLFCEKPRLRSIIAEKITEYDIPYTAIKAIKQGQDYVLPNGTVLSNSELTRAPLPPRSYAYCSDTAYNEAIIEQIVGVNLLYHEATYSKEYTAIAAERGHATAEQAAEIAKKAGAKQLLLGHFSARYPNPEVLVAEARAVFKPTIAAEEGKVYEIECL